jgi:hypothetical protein
VFLFIIITPLKIGSIIGANKRSIQGLRRS